MRTVTSIVKADVTAAVSKALKVAVEDIRWCPEFQTIGDELPIAEIDGAPRQRRARGAKAAIGPSVAGTKYRGGRKARTTEPQPTDNQPAA